MTNRTKNRAPALPEGILGYVLRWTMKRQLGVIFLGAIGLPLLYLTLELPKLIIDCAISGEAFPREFLGRPFDQVELLALYSIGFLLAFAGFGAVKFCSNVYAGLLAEIERRRLRLAFLKRWRRAGGLLRGGEFAPMIAQEVEPVGGFVGEAFKTPLLQGGTVAVAVGFMVMQEPILGLAALTLVPVQIALIPRLQRQINALARERIVEIRRVSGELSGDGSLALLLDGFRRIQERRDRFYRKKFLLKFLLNFVGNVVPFLFYAIGGWLVIEDRLSLGALVATLAAYRELTPPLRELFRYYQSYEDVRVRYTEALRSLSAGSSIDPPVVGAEGARFDGLARVGAGQVAW